MRLNEKKKGGKKAGISTRAFTLKENPSKNIEISKDKTHICVNSGFLKSNYTHFTSVVSALINLILGSINYGSDVSLL